MGISVDPILVLNYNHRLMLPMILQLENVTKKYSKGENLFESISLHIQKGDAISILGSNGAGKSTLMQIIAGLESPTQGTRRATIKNLRIGFLPQNAAQTLLPIRAKEVMLGFERSALTGLQKKYLELFQLTDQLEATYRSLSLGQKRKVLILRNLGANDLMLFDEPFASLDRTSQEVLISLFRELKSEGRTFITILHDHHLSLDFFNKTLTLRKCCE